MSTVPTLELPVIRCVEEVFTFDVDGALVDHWCGGELRVAFGDAGPVEFVFLEGQRHGADMDGFAEGVGGYVPYEPAGLFRVEDRVFPAAVRVLVCGKHHHGRVDGQVLPLEVGGFAQPSP